MRAPLIVAGIAATIVTSLPWDSAKTLHGGRTAVLRESRIPIGKASLYSREVGRGQPIIVLHGGPDFDHAYLLPDLDRLADVHTERAPKVQGAGAGRYWRAMASVLPSR
jgi:proline iminopeptidase